MNKFTSLYLADDTFSAFVLQFIFRFCIYLLPQQNNDEIVRFVGGGYATPRQTAKIKIVRIVYGR
jgi:hypothetical protein